MIGESCRSHREEILATEKEKQVNEKSLEGLFDILSPVTDGDAHFGWVLIGYYSIVKDKW